MKQSFLKEKNSPATGKVCTVSKCKAVGVILRKMLASITKNSDLLLQPAMITHVCFQDVRML